MSQSPARIIAFGFAATIILGSLILMLPISLNDGVNLKYIDSLYTATSAVCVTGLITVDPANTFTPFGRFILAVLIQIGGLGITSLGTGIIIAMGKRVNFKSRSLVKEALNLNSGKGIVKFIKEIFFTTISFELIGTILSFIAFSKDFSFAKALGISAFHSIAAFNNSGFDILGNFQSLAEYKNNVYLNVVTCMLIILGGIGFFVIKDIKTNKLKWKSLSMHSKVVIWVTVILIIFGAIMIKLTNNITWLGALFNSVSARTAGFSTFNLSNFSNAGIIVMIVLMFIGASPGSTGGGIKTTTVFVLFKGIVSAATNKGEKAFKYAIPKNAFRKAAVVTVLGINVVLIGTFLISIFEPQLELRDILFEVVSAYGTVGLTTGITTSLSAASKILSMIIMFIGRLGPMTIVTLWYFSRGERVSYPEGNISIG
ncbi:MAG: H(+)-transporting ATPase [Eubacterium sp.]|nr:H(+)-transporting ATPase [Eubacterium sp.]MBS6901611.1 H(+)-transporting ATPase [Eubacterium sp.]